MKQTILTLAFTTLAAASMAQCTFDQQFAGQGPGMFPDVLAPVSTCVGCGGHTRTVSLVTNTQMLVANPLTPGSFITLYIDATKVLSVEGNPAGTTYGTDLGLGPNSMGTWFNTGTVPNQTAVQGCSYVTGDESAWNAAIGGGPNSDGIYPLVITVDARIHSSSPDVSGFVPNGSWASTVPANLGGGPIIFDTYQIVVTPDGVVSIEERASKFGAFPNPAADVLRFNMGGADRAFVELFDLSGSRVAQTVLVGSNAALPLDGVAEGLYIYRLSSEDGTVLRSDRVAVVR